MKSKSIIYLLLCMPIWGLAQYQSGLRTDNYNLLNNQTLNPAAFVSFTQKWQINVIEADIFASNNYAYLKNVGLLGLRNTNTVFAKTGDTEDQNFNDPNKVEYNVVDSKRRLFAYANINLMGPSLGLKIGDNFYAALSERFRSHTNTKGVDNILSYNTYDQYPLLTEGHVDPFHLNHLTWGEVNLTLGYAGTFVGDKSAIAVTLKYLKPYEGLYFRSNRQLTFSKYSGDSILVDQADFDIAFSPLFYDNEVATSDIKSHGSGFGLDIGFMTLIGGDETDYQYKLGFSISDLGRVKFNDSKYYNFSNNQNFEFLTQHYEQADNIQELLMTFSDQTLGDTLLVEQDKALTIWTPAKLGLQFDYRIWKNTFAQFSYYKSIPFKKSGLEAADQISLSPRIEYKWWGASLPITLIQYQHLTIGTSLRLGPLVIGSDNILSLFKKSRLYGSDIYFALIINPFKIRESKGVSYKSKRSKKEARCYSF